MIRLLVSVVMLCAVVTSGASAQIGAELKLPRQPAVSPDGNQLSFSHQGDLWIAPAAGGLATRVTSSPAREDVSMWSPDGRTLAFQSNRFGNTDIFVVDLAGGEPRRLTFHSAADRLAGFSADGSEVFFLSRRETMEGRGAGELWRIPVAGGTERLVSAIAMFDAAVSPDGRRVAFTRGAESWWRKDYRGAANLDVWVMDLPTGTPRRLTTWEGNDFAPMWHPEGSGVWFVREKDRAHNIWWQPLTGEAVQVTTLATPGVRFPQINARGTHLAFEAEDGAFVLELDVGAPAKPKVAPRRVSLRGFVEAPAVDLEVAVKDDATEYDLSPDEKAIAVVSGGEIFCYEKKKTDPKHIRRLTDTAVAEHDICFAADGESILYVSDASGEDQIWRVASAEPDEKRLWRARRFKTEKLTETPGEKRNLELSPDGKTLAYVRGLGALVLADPLTIADRKIISEGFSQPRFAWAPDSRWLGVAREDNDFNSDVFIVDTTGEKPDYNVSRHPNRDGAPSFDGKGRFIAFDSKDGLGPDTDIRVCFLKKSDFDRSALDWEDENADQPKKGGKGATSKPAGDPAASRPAGEPETQPASKAESRGAAESGPASRGGKSESKPAKKVDPVVIDFAGLHKRVRRPATGLGARSNPVGAPDGKTIAFMQAGAEAGLYVVDFDGKDKKKVQTGPAPQVRWVGEDIFYLSAGQVCSTTKSGAKTTFSFSGTRTRRPREERKLVFAEAWRRMRDHFYDPALHGADWKGAFARFAPWAADASTPEDLGMVMSLLLGELNGSHLGFGPAETWVAPNPSRTADLGVIWDGAFAGPGLRIARVLDGTPGAREKSRLMAGDIVLGLNDTRFDAAHNAWAAFDHMAGKDVRLTVKRGDAEKDVLIQPVASSARARYDDMVERRQEQTHQASDGQIGYTHVAGMSEPEFLEFERDLFAEGFDKKALIIDVRDNGGGWTADYLYTVLTQPHHAITTPRGGGPGYPQDRRIFAAWSKPIVVLCNEFSYSNAEIFAHGIKTLKRGKIVGQPTYGAVISTGAFTLMDGSSLRNPFRGWQTLDGVNMEHHGCVPDFVVENPPEEIPRGRDRQLEKAIAVALDAVK